MKTLLQILQINLTEKFCVAAHCSEFLIFFTVRKMRICKISVKSTFLLELLFCDLISRNIFKQERFCSLKKQLIEPKIRITFPTFKNVGKPHFHLDSKRTLTNSAQSYDGVSICPSPSVCSQYYILHQQDQFYRFFPPLSSDSWRLS